MKKLVIAILAIAVIAALVVVNLKNQGKRGDPVEVEKVERRTVIGIVEASGRLEPAVSVDLSSDVIGRVVEVAVAEGAAVKRGDLLIRIDPSQYQLRVKSARATLEAAQSRLAEVRANVARARSDWERSRNLAAQKLISEQAEEAAGTAHEALAAQQRTLEHSIEQARAGREEAEDALAKTAIHSPMDGIVVRRNVEVGEVAVSGTINNQGSLLMTVADLATMRAEIDVDETDVVNVKDGQPAEVKLDAFPDRSFPGRVTEVARSAVLESSGPALAAQTKSADYKVKVTLTETDPELRPGLSTTVRITTAVRDDVVSVPIQAVVVRDPEAPGGPGAPRAKSATSRNKGKPKPTPTPTPARDGKKGKDEKEKEGVFVVEGDVAHFRLVKLGITGERYFELKEVKDGVKAGDVIVTGPFQKLRVLKDGDRVKPEERDPESRKGGAWQQKK